MASTTKRKSKRAASKRKNTRAFGQTAAGDSSRAELIEWIKSFSDDRAREFIDQKSSPKPKLSAENQAKVGRRAGFLAESPAPPDRAAFKRLKDAIVKQDRKWGSEEFDGALGGRAFVGLSLFFNDPWNDMLEYDVVQIAAICTGGNAWDRAIDGLVSLAITLDPSASLVEPLSGK